MSQITRCPSCATSFKVVADQLRISEGWVRCGQCKEVFDASAHLLPVAPQALLPDVSLTDVRPPPAPVARRADTARAWGGGVVSGTVPGEGLALGGAGGGGALRTTVHADAEGHAGAASPMVSAPLATTPVLEIPAPTVPAFLAAGAAASDENTLSLAPAVPFAWRPAPSPLLAGAAPPNPPPLGRGVGASGAEDAASVWFAEDLPLSAGPPGAADAAKATEALQGGYELPAADLQDSGWPADLAAAEAAEDGSAVAQAAMALPEAEEDAPVQELAAVAPSAPLDGPLPAPLPAVEPVPEPLPSVDFVQPPGEEEVVPPAALDLAADDSPAAVLLARARTPVSDRAHPDEQDEQDEEEAHGAGQEVSFVVAARRKAFWRKPVVRAVLGLVALVLALGLVLQMAVQERDRIAAMDARTRPWLLQLCEPLQCEIAPQRQIADVVIDSSSFNKARGDSYQLALAMKSRADIPLAMPAVELTLTDAQDQPVLRRVLLPTDMAAPAELPARGEWSTSVSVIVTTGGARVAGYRLLAFYP